MSVAYTNRVGKKYFLREGKTKTGKPRYFFSSKKEGKGALSTAIPEGYEIYEHPENAQVFLRKIRPRLITALEEQFVKRSLTALRNPQRYIVDCKDKTLTIYESNANMDHLKDLLGGLLNKVATLSDTTTDDKLAGLVQLADQNYTAILRFSLAPQAKRQFTAERFCFKGAIDDWIYLSGPDDFIRIVKKHVRTIGTDAFFDSY